MDSEDFEDFSENPFLECGQDRLRTDALPRKHSKDFDIAQQSQPSADPSTFSSSPPAVNYSLDLLSQALPTSSLSSPRDFNRNPYTETSYTPKRFRPEEYERESPSDDELLGSMVSASRAWLPPEDPVEILEAIDSPVSPTSFSRSANEYTGAVLRPGQLSSITTYGFPGGAFTQSNRKKPTTYENAAEALLSESELRQHKPKLTTSVEELPGLDDFTNSPATSSNETQINSGAQLTHSDQASRTFAVRAKQAGISDWNEKVTKGLRGNNSVFDGRWVLDPNEAWNVPARRTSVPVNAFDGRSTNTASGNRATAKPTGGATHAELVKLEEGPVQPDQAHSEKFIDISKQSGKEWQCSNELENVPEAEESRRLEQYVTDLSLANGGLGGMLESYDPTNICRVFYQRVFDDPEPEPPYGEDAEKRMKHKGRIVTYRELHFKLIEEINDLVAYMTAPIGERALQKLMHGRKAVKNGHSGTMNLSGLGSMQDITRSASNLEKVYESERQLRLLSGHQPFHKQVREEVSYAEERHPSERIRSLIEPVGAQSTDFTAAFVDPSSGSVAAGDVVAPKSPLFRPQNRFGDPATAEFNPLTNSNAAFPARQDSSLSILNWQPPVTADSAFLHGGPPFPTSTFSAYQPAGDEFRVDHPGLERPSDPDKGTAKRPSRTHPNLLAATNFPYGNAVAPGMALSYADTEDRYGASNQSQIRGTHAHSLVHHSHLLYGSSHGTGFHSQTFQQPFAERQVMPLLQAPSRTHLGGQAQDQMQIAAQSHRHAELLSQSYGLPGQTIHPDTHYFASNVSEQQRNPDQKSLQQVMAGQYQRQHQRRQSFFPYQNYQQRAPGDMYGSDPLTGMTLDQSFEHTPSVGLRAHTQHGAAPGSTAHAYVQPYIPADKYARAPAPNRLASRVAQTNGFQSMQPKLAISNPMVQTRYPTPIQSLRNNLATVRYRAGSDNMLPTQIPGVASVRYQDLTRSEPPRFAVTGDENYIPFAETTKLSRPAEWGVLKVSNMPYDITRDIIYAFLGTHAKTITPDLGPCIHIMMDRSTGKTQDCFIEFFSVPDARAWYTVIMRRGPHLNKIGDRMLEVELSSQEELMKELFPRARCVIWNGISGLQIKETEEAFDSGFKGFITQEELKGLIHHAEQPHRSLYTQKCPPRPYTNLISILAKFPWHATQHYSLSTRNALYTATLTLVKTLTSFLRRSPSSSIMSQGIHRLHHSNPPYDSNTSAAAAANPFRPDLSANELTRVDMRDKGLNESLLKELVMAGMNAYGFSDRQRWELYLAGAGVLGRQWMRLSPLMARWPWEVVGRKAMWEEDVVEFYANLLSTHPSLHQHHQQTNDNNNHNNDNMPFGPFDTQLYETSIEGYKDQTVTMWGLGQWEMSVIRGVIRAACV